MTDIRIHRFDDLNQTSQQEVAQFVSTYTGACEQAEKIAPITVEDLLQTDTALVAFVQDAFAGYVRAKEPISMGSSSHFVEVGSLVVAKEFRGVGIGGRLIDVMTHDILVKRNVPFAFCNTRSTPLFMQTGYHVADVTQLPKRARSRYGNTPLLYPHMSKV